MLTLNFYSIDEKTPKHNQEIVYFRPMSSFGCSGYEMTVGDVEYAWSEIDDGVDNGNSVCYNHETKLDGHRLDVFFGSVHSDGCYWLDLETYLNCFNVK